MSHSITANLLRQYDEINNTLLWKLIITASILKVVFRFNLNIYSREKLFCVFVADSIYVTYCILIFILSSKLNISMIEKRLVVIASSVK